MSNPIWTQLMGGTPDELAAQAAQAEEVALMEAAAAAAAEDEGLRESLQESDLEAVLSRRKAAQPYSSSSATGGAEEVAPGGDGSPKRGILETLLQRDAGSGAAASKERCRIDPRDGFAYSKDDFVRRYGGTKEWSAATALPEPPKRAANSGGLLSELVVRMPPKRMGLDEEYRTDPADGDVYTRAQFVEKYGVALGAQKWDLAKPGAVQPKVELNPREGDIVLFRTKGALSAEGVVAKRQGLRVRCLVSDAEGNEKMTWMEVKDVVKIVAVFEEKCTNFRVNVLAVDFGRCKCGRTKAQHDKSAIRRKSGLYREVGAGPQAAARPAHLDVKLRDHRLDHPATRGGGGGADYGGAEPPRASTVRFSPEPPKPPGGSSGGDPELVLEDEYRLDPVDGYAYTKEDFVAKYGGTIEWAKAKKVNEGAEDGDSAASEPAAVDPVAESSAAPSVAYEASG